MKHILTILCTPFRLLASIIDFAVDTLLIGYLLLACLLCAAWDAVVMGEGEEGLT